MEDNQKRYTDMNSNPIRNNNRIIAGLFLLVVGGLLMAKNMGVSIPDWIFSWQMLLITIGVFNAIAHRFRNNLWLILIIVGGVGLADKFDPTLNLHRLIWPLVIILIGLVFILRPRRHHRFDRRYWKEEWKRKRGLDTDAVNRGCFTTEETGEFIESTSVFSGTKKIVLSKNFKGGDITCFMGGAEIDLTQADMQTPATLDVTAVFGGAKIFVPSSWDIKNKITPVFGGVDDKRTFHNTNVDYSKQLVLEGAVVFGGVEIRNY
jgi:predicted membrane protein